MLLKPCLLLPVLALLAGCTEPATPPPVAPPSTASAAVSSTDSTPADLFSAAERSAADSISAERLRGIVAEIADDLYEGRAPGTAGDRLTRQYLIQQMSALGLQPGGENGTWEQVFDLIGITSAQPPLWRFTSAAGELDLTQSDDFIAASGVQDELAEIADAEVVFVGYGIQAPEYQWDDFKGMDRAARCC